MSSGSLAPYNRFRLEASKTPESPATDSSLTAAETDLVFVPEDEVLDKAATFNSSSGSNKGGGVSEIGDNCASLLLS